MRSHLQNTESPNVPLPLQLYVTPMKIIFTYLKVLSGWIQIDMGDQGLSIYPTFTKI